MCNIKWDSARAAGPSHGRQVILYAPGHLAQSQSTCALWVDTHEQRLAAGRCSLRQRCCERVSRRKQPFWRGTRVMLPAELDTDAPVDRKLQMKPCVCVVCVSDRPEQHDCTSLQGRLSGHNTACALQCGRLGQCHSAAEELVQQIVPQSTCLKCPGPLGARAAAALCRKREAARSSVASSWRWVGRVQWHTTSVSCSKHNACSLSASRHQRQRLANNIRSRCRAGQPRYQKARTSISMRDTAAHMWPQ